MRPKYASYAASYAAMEIMAKILAKELRRTSITVNCVAPGPIATYMLFSERSQDNIMGLIEACPMGRLGVTMDVAKIVGFLASDNREWVYGKLLVLVVASSQIKIMFIKFVNGVIQTIISILSYIYDVKIHLIWTLSLFKRSIFCILCNIDPFNKIMPTEL